MARKPIHIGKMLLLLLSLLIPFFLYQNYTNRVKSFERNALLKTTLAEERRGLLRQVLQKRVDNLQKNGTEWLTKELPDGEIVGLQPMLDRSSFASEANLVVNPSSMGTPNLLAMLHAEDRFFSGLPKRYAALVELLNQPERRLTEADIARLHAVATAFWRGSGMSDGNLALLIEKLPDWWRSAFDRHRLLLGDGDLPDTDRIWIKFEQNNRRSIVTLPLEDLTGINRDLQSLQLDFNLAPSQRWNHFSSFSISLSPVDVPMKRLLGFSRLRHIALLIGLELMVFAIYFVFNKYERIQALQRQLLAATSHELRTPLTVMRQFAEMLVDHETDFSKKYRRYHQFILRECVKMQFLVENLLTTAKFEHLKLNLQPTTFSLRDLVTDVADSMANLSEETSIERDVPAREVHWDRGVMEQVLVNLIDNARVHAKTDVRVSARFEADRVLLEIRDYNPNVDVNQIQKIKAFNPKRGHSSGLGLGLFLCGEMVKAHGGQMAFRDAKPGLAVALTLPRFHEIV